MVGVNPQDDAYGFRNWTIATFAEHHSTGAFGHLEGFLAALWSASFFVVGSEYLSIAAAEAKRPRIYVKQAFKTAYWRFAIFFIGGAFCVSTVIPKNDPTLTSILEGAEGGGTASASPYVIAMKNLGTGVLPHIVNALLITSIFSAGNTYTYCAIRSLYGLALSGKAQASLMKCTKQGVPIYCFAITMIFPMLSFLQLSNGSATVLQWLINLVTAGCVIDYRVIVYYIPVFLSRLQGPRYREEDPALLRLFPAVRRLGRTGWHHLHAPVLRIFQLHPLGCCYLLHLLRYAHCWHLHVFVLEDIKEDRGCTCCRGRPCLGETQHRCL